MDCSPFHRAGDIYEHARKYGEKLAQAAEQHSQVPFTTDQTLLFESSQDNVVKWEESSDEEAYADMMFYSRLLSEAWDKSIEYFMHDFDAEVKKFAQEQEDTKLEEIADNYDLMIGNYTALEHDLQNLDVSVQGYLENTPSDSPAEFPPLRPPQILFTAAD